MHYHIVLEFGIPIATKWIKVAFKWLALWFRALSREKCVPLLPPLVIIIIALLDHISRLLCNLALSALISRTFTSVELNVCLILWQSGSCHPGWKKKQRKNCLWDKLNVGSKPPAQYLNIGTFMMSCSEINLHFPCVDRRWNCFFNISN